METSISILCLFVNMKRLQNEKFQISTDLIWNLKIKIISLSVLNWYFFENHQLCILSYLIEIESYQIVSYWFLVLIFQSCPCLPVPCLTCWLSGVYTGEKILYIVAIASSGNLKRWKNFYWNCITQQNCWIQIVWVKEPLGRFLTQLL
jgi:hypothetical protein